MKESTAVVLVREFATREGADAYAREHEGKTFTRYWTVAEMRQRTLNWARDYAIEQATGKPEWATRMLDLWLTDVSFRARAEDPIEPYEGKDGKWYAGVPDTLKQVEIYDSVEERTVTIDVKVVATDALAKAVDADEVVLAGARLP